MAADGARLTAGRAGFRWCSGWTRSATHERRRRAPVSHAQSIRNVVEEGVLADQVGVDYFGIGEHHTDDFRCRPPTSCSPRSPARPSGSGSARRSPCSARTTRCGCTSATRRWTRLQRSGRGHPRARIVHRVVPALRLRPDDYEELFEEKLELFAELLKAEPVTWDGHTRAAADATRRLPAPRERPAHDLDRRRRQPGVRGARRPVRVLADARDHRRVAGAVHAVRRALPRGARAVRAGRCPVGMHSPGHVAATDEQAPRSSGPATGTCSRIGARARVRAPTRESFDREVGPTARSYVGSPETVAGRSRPSLTALEATRFDLKYGMAGLSHDRAHDGDRAVRNRGRAEGARAARGLSP